MKQGQSCILLDVQIPGLSGPELQDRLAERGSTLPIVFLTGHGDIPTTVQAIKGGCGGLPDQARAQGQAARCHRARLGQGPVEPRTAQSS